MTKRKIKNWEYVEAYIELKRLEAINDRYFSNLQGAYECNAKHKTIEQVLFHYWINEAGDLRKENESK